MPAAPMPANAEGSDDYVLVQDTTCPVIVIVNTMIT